MKQKNFFLLVFCLFLFLSLGFSQGRVGIVLSGKFDKLLLQNIQKMEKKIYGLEVDFIGEFSLPREKNICYACDSVNYNVYAFIDTLEKFISKKYTKIIGFTHKNLVFGDDQFYHPVLGLTYNTENSCLVTDYNFRDDSSLYIIKTTNVVLHESGHFIFGRSYHCSDINCIMVEYEGLENTDLCKKCKAKLLDIKKHKQTSSGGTGSSK